jgi:hypothetical protein
MEGGIEFITMKNPSWPLDTEITHKKMTGLNAPSKERGSGFPFALGIKP